MSNKVAIVIPARYNSKRFPGKPLAKIHGLSVIQRVWNIAKSVYRKSASDINIQAIIATDNRSIFNHCREFNSNVVMTPETCRNGTERVAYIAEEDKAFVNDYTQDDIFINLQGDAVLTPPWVIQDLIDVMINDNSIKLATPAVRLNEEQYEMLINNKERGVVSGTTVTFSKSGNALYFTKGIIPYIRNKNDVIPVYKHIGLYAYRKKILLKLSKQSPTKLEKAEGLEQLRALENDIPIKVVVTDYKDRTQWSVDNPEDISIIEKIIEKEGELVNI